ncbi:MAG TPA: hypothetical protein VL946_08395, partial [Lacibacter sp.]|nr:hypothetical protein [Lacibacter sp.]
MNNNNEETPSALQPAQSETGVPTSEEYKDSVQPQDRLIITLRTELEAKDMKIAEMEGDILTTVETLAGVLQSLGINPSDFSGTGKPGDLMQKIAMILPKVTMQFAT